jgi:Flp pilus assembly pilin Flp
MTQIPTANHRPRQNPRGLLTLRFGTSRATGIDVAEDDRGRAFRAERGSGCCSVRAAKQESNCQENAKMNTLVRLYVKLREKQKGQTMTEYALIMAAVAVVVFITYQTMGQDISSLVNKVNTDLTASS